MCIYCPMISLPPFDSPILMAVKFLSYVWLSQGDTFHNEEKKVWYFWRDMLHVMQEFKKLAKPLISI
jgi:hypothetical protein